MQSRNYLKELALTSNVLADSVCCLEAIGMVTARIKENRMYHENSGLVQIIFLPAFGVFVLAELSDSQICP
jgi:hypothetical protein